MIRSGDSFRCVLRPLAAGAVCLVLDGELDLASADTFRMHINTASADGAKVFIFDLRGLTYLDSTGINAFLDMHRALSPSGRRLALVGPSRVVRRILGVLEVEQLIPIFDSLEDALTALRAGEVS